MEKRYEMCSVPLMENASTHAHKSVAISALYLPTEKQKRRVPLIDDHSIEVSKKRTRTVEDRDESHHQANEFLSD